MKMDVAKLTSTIDNIFYLARASFQPCRFPYNVISMQLVINVTMQCDVECNSCKVAMYFHAPCTIVLHCNWFVNIL